MSHKSIKQKLYGLKTLHYETFLRLYYLVKEEKNLNDSNFMVMDLNLHKNFHGWLGSFVFSYLFFVKLQIMNILAWCEISFAETKVCSSDFAVSKR